MTYKHGIASQARNDDSTLSLRTKRSGMKQSYVYFTWDGFLLFPSFSRRG